MRSKLIFASVLSFLFLISTVASFAYFSYQKVIVKTSPEQLDKSDRTATSPTPTPDPLAPYNILLLGYGGGGHAGGEITDTMIVAHVVPRLQQIDLISIPRDIWVPLPLTNESPVYRKINSAYPLGNDSSQYLKRPSQYQGESGGANLSEYAVELVTGLKIRYFVVVNFAAFEQAINNLGGINVSVPVSFTDEYYPITGLEDDSCGKSDEDIAAITATMSGYKLEQEFKCRYETLEFSSGLQPMDGGTALKFVRSRHSETYGNDFSRSQRQQAVIEAIQTKILSLGSLPKLVPLINTLTQHLRTDITIGTIRQIWSTHGDLSDYTFKTLNLTTQNVLTESRSSDGQYILVPKDGEENWQSIHKYLETQLAEFAEAD